MRQECLVWRLSELSRPQLRAHFGQLSGDDLYLRFGDHRSPHQLQRYVSSIDFWQSTLLGVFNGRLELVGVAQIFPHGGACELSMSVLPGSRALGIGALLLRHALQYARLTGACRVYMHCASENRRIIRLGTRLGVQFTLTGGDAEGVIELAPVTPWGVWAELLEAQSSLLGMGLRARGYGSTAQARPSSS